MTPRRFEIPGIRSWRTSRRDTGGPQPGRNGTSGGSGDADLTAVLDRWDRQLAREEKAQRAVEDQRARFREDAERRLRTLIGPTLEAMGREIGARGHAWAVEERIDIQAQPAIAASFRPASSNGTQRRPSEVCFRFQFPDRLAVSGAVAAGGGLDDLPARSYDMGELDAELVKREVTRLIAATLRTT